MDKAQEIRKAQKWRRFRNEECLQMGMAYKQRRLTNEESLERVKAYKWGKPTGESLKGKVYKWVTLINREELQT